MKFWRQSMLDYTKFVGAESVFRYFDEISKIPRGSGNTEKIADYLVSFANEHRLFYTRDNTGNVIIKKNATRGYQSRPSVILQGHTDMVIAVDPDVSRDMLSFGPSIYVDGDFLKAEGTTLGADNGIAVAYMLAVLDSDTLRHPAIEAVFTADEEIGLIGAGNIDTSLLYSKTMINLDSDDEGVFIAGCAGGVRADITLPVLSKPCDYAARLVVSGLRGGHSGVEINDGRVNAISLLFDLIPDGASIGEIKGGNASARPLKQKKHNACEHCALRPVCRKE